MAKYKPKSPANLKPGGGTARPGKSSGSSLVGVNNAPTAPSPWPLEGRRPYGGPQQVKGQPKLDPSGR